MDYGAELELFGQHLSPGFRGLDFSRESPSTSPPSPGLPPPSNACATFARSGLFQSRPQLGDERVLPVALRSANGTGDRGVF